MPPAAGCPPVMPHSSTSAAPPWSPMPAATVPACPGAAPPAPPPRPGRRGRTHWPRRFRPRHRSPARRCPPGQATPNSLPCPQRPSPLQHRRHRPQWPVPPARRTTAGKPNYAHAAVRRTRDQAGSGHRQPDADSHLEGHLGPAAASRPSPVTPPRLSSRHRATSINNITPSDGEIRENARRAAVLDGQSGVGVAVQVAPELVICAATCMVDMADQLPARADGPAAEARM